MLGLEQPQQRHQASVLDHTRLVVTVLGKAAESKCSLRERRGDVMMGAMA